MSKKKVRFSIIMPILIQHDYQYRMTSTCIANIEAFSYDYELLVFQSLAGNPSHDVKKLLRKKDRLFKFKDNPSQASLVNMGIKKAKGDYIILIGNDNFVHQDWLREIDRHLWRTDIHIFACSVDRVPYGKSKDRYQGGVKFISFSYVNFQGVTIPKKIFNDIGMIDENLPFYFWERDMNARLDAKGYRVGAVLDSFMTTPGQMTRLDTLPRGVQNWWSDESNAREIEYYTKKWGVHP